MKSGNSNSEWVLKRKTGAGKISSLRDQKSLALQLYADTLEENEKGGGIVSLLLPKTTKESLRLLRISKSYVAVRVKPRGGETKRTMRQTKRSFFSEDEPMLTLARLFAMSIKPGPQAFSTKAFLRWLNLEVANKGQGHKILSSKWSELINSDDDKHHKLQHSERWWKDQIGLRKKS